MSARRRRRVLAAAGALLAAAVLSWAFLVEPRRLRTVEVRIPLDGLRSSARALLVSDIDFPSLPSREDGVLRRARAASPDLVLLAGDLIDRHRLAKDPQMVRAAGIWAASLGDPAFAAPGEEESPALPAIAASWAPLGVELLANENRIVVVGDQEIDLFVADLPRDPPPWGLARSGTRRFAEQPGRAVHGFLVEGTERDWAGTETTLAFRIGAPETYLDLHVGWVSGDGAVPRRGFKVGRHASRPSFRLDPGKEIRAGSQGRRDTGFAPRPWVWCRARIRVEDDGTTARLAVRMWEDGDPEPAAWNAEITLPSPPGGFDGAFAVGGRRGEKAIADLRVADLAGRPLAEERFDDETAFRARWSDTSRLGRWLRARDPGRPSILLAHNPDVVLDVLRAGGRPPGLVVAGHTHGGQIHLPLIGALFTSTALGRSYDAGLFRVGGVPLYITAGVGTSVLPARFLVPPEVVILRLEPPEGR